MDNQPQWVDTPSALDSLIADLSREPLVAVDTEGDSLYSYYDKVCLIQFSTPDQDYLLDPLAVDVSCLASFFATPSTQKIFHAAEYDFLSLKRDYGFTFTNLFDTMLAARILGWSQYGLGSLLSKHFGVKLDKRFQRYNWGKRPLGLKALKYARLDTHYLIPLREIQLEELKKQDRLREAYEAFERLTHVEPTFKEFDPDDFWRVKGAKDLQPYQQAVLRELFILRDQTARKLDRPPFKVINDAALVGLSKSQPQSVTALKEVKGLGGKLIKYNHVELLNAIKRGQAAPQPEYPNHSHHRPDNSTLNRYESLRQWRNQLAAKRGVEPDVIMNNNTLMNIARHNPQSMHGLTQMEVLGDWQREAYGKKLLKVLKSQV